MRASAGAQKERPPRGGLPIHNAFLALCAAALTRTSFHLLACCLELSPNLLGQRFQLRPIFLVNGFDPRSLRVGQIEVLHDLTVLSSTLAHRPACAVLSPLRRPGQPCGILGLCRHFSGTLAGQFDSSASGASSSREIEGETGETGEASIW